MNTVIRNFNLSYNKGITVRISTEISQPLIINEKQIVTTIYRNKNMYMYSYNYALLGYPVSIATVVKSSIMFFN